MTTSPSLVRITIVLVTASSAEAAKATNRGSASSARRLKCCIQASLRVRGEADRFDLVRMIDLAVVGLCASLELVDDVHVRDHFAEDRIFAVQERSIAEADEKLRICGIRVVGTRDPHRGGLERFLGELGRNVR